MISKVTIRGSLDYKEILSIQTEEFEKRVNLKKIGKDIPEDIIFFVEHRPVYTLGKHGKHSNLLLSQAQLESNGIEYVEIDRGGDITYHGPGQLTVYPVMDLQRYRLGVKDYVHLLEESVIQTLYEYGLKGERVDGKTGVWIGKGTDNERKISAIGVKLSRFISMHGLSLNIGSDISKFGGIVPCGLSNIVTSISLELQKEIGIEEVEEILWNKLIGLLLPRIPSQGNS